jgi:hypothetical protein
VALLLVLVIAPFVERWPLTSALLVSFLLVAGVFAAHDHPTLRRVVVMAVVIVLVLRWLAHLYGEQHESLVTVAHLAICVYMLLLGMICVAAVLRRQRITHDTVVGAVCGYLLIGYVFTFGYAALEDISPGSFSSNVVLPQYSDAAKIGHETPELLYYSFVTLTTAGYGDIVPAGRMARSLAILEMLAGQLYLAAFVARLVGVLGTGTNRDASYRQNSPSP